MKLFGKSQSKKTEVYPEPETVSPFSEAEAAVEAPLVLKIEGSDSAEKPAPPTLVLQEAKADGTAEGDLLSELEDILGQNAEKAEPEIVIPAEYGATYRVVVSGDRESGYRAALVEKG